MEKIKKIFLDFISTYNITEEDLTKEGGYSGGLDHFFFLKNIFKVYKHIVIGNKDKAIFQFKLSLEEMDFSIDFEKSSDEEIEIALKRRNLIKELKNLYTETKESIYSPLIEIASKHDFFKGETLSEEDVSADILIQVSDWLDKKYLKKYVLKQGTFEIPKDLDQFVISKELYLCTNLNYFLDNFNKQYDDDIVRVTAFFKIEKEIEYSYFMFIMNYKDHVIAFSDLLLFENPHMAGASRNPRRKVEEKQQSGGLPYQLIDDLNSIREDSSNLATIGNNVEFHKLNWSRFGQGQRMFILLILKELVFNLSDGKANLLISAEKHFNQKLLEGATIDSNVWDNEEKDFTNWNDSTKEYAEELVEMLVDKEKSKELIKTTYDIVTTSELYDETLLAPAHIHEKHARWHIINDHKLQLQESIGYKYTGWGFSTDRQNKAEEQYKKGKKELKKMFDSKFESIIKKLTQAKHVYFKPEDYRFNTFSAEKKESLLDFRFYEVKGEDPEHYILPSFSIGSRYGYYPKDEEGEKCPLLPKYKGSTQYCFKITHYSQLMYLLDCKREDLPDFYKCFKAHHMVPYHGNTILDNVHPLATLFDPASSMEPNGFLIGVNMSKRGINKLIKETCGKNRPEKLAVNIKGESTENIDTENANYSFQC